MPTIITRGAASARALGFAGASAAASTPKRFGIFMGQTGYTNAQMGYINDNLVWANTQLGGNAGSTFDIYCGGNGTGNPTPWSGNVYSWNINLTNYDAWYWGNGSQTNQDARDSAWNGYSAGKGIGQMMFITGEYEASTVYGSGVPSGYRISNGNAYTNPGGAPQVDLSGINQPFCKNIGTVAMTDSAYCPTNLVTSGAGVGYGTGFNGTGYMFVVADQAGVGRRWDSSYGTYADSGWMEYQAYNTTGYANILKQTVQALYWLAQSPLP